MIISRVYLIFVIAVICHGCSKKGTIPGEITPDFPTNLVTPLYSNIIISTDKAAYNPGEAVTFTIDNAALPASARVRYKYLNTILSENTISGPTWTWKTPVTDYSGYSAEVYSSANGAETICSVIGIDVSSDWKKFPRYGFISKFPQLNDGDVNRIISNLNRYHINGLQFYDWQNKHHKPLPLSGSVPATTWKDILNRDIYFSTVQKYIASAHSYNMKAMFYDLVYGAWDSGEADGVLKEWYLYSDNTHTNKDLLSLPYISNIYLLDPSNTSWQQYLINQIKIVYQFLDFDGYHIDQVGDRGTRYTFDGAFLNLAETFKPFIEAIRTEEPHKDLVMNAVAQYGQKGIAGASTDFLYTEVWSPFDTYSDLGNLIQQNNALRCNSKNTVLAAYVNYDLSKNKGYFNTPSVLMANAVIFAFGGAHLELGEHMLGNEYFPNENLSMKSDLKSALVNYYDFLVAYENLLRGGGSFNSVSLVSSDNKMLIGGWPASEGTVSVTAKKVGSTQVIQLINFKNSTTLNWRDNSGIQTAPAVIKDAKLILTSNTPVKKLWTASPDIIGGASRALAFVQTGHNVSFTLPELHYWSMIVIEY